MSHFQDIETVNCGVYVRPTQDDYSASAACGWRDEPRWRLAMLLRSLVVAVSLLVAGFAHAQTNYPPPFPRLAILATGGPHDYYLPERQAELSRYNISLIQAYPGWEGWRGITY